MDAVAVGVVKGDFRGRHQGHARRPGCADRAFLSQAVAPVAVGAESEEQGVGGHVAAQAVDERDAHGDDEQPLVTPAQGLAQVERFVQVPRRDQSAQGSVAFEVAGQQEGALLRGGAALEQLDAEDRLDAGLPRGGIERDGPVHGIAVGQGHGPVAETPGGVDQLVRAARPVEQTGVASHSQRYTHGTGSQHGNRRRESPVCASRHNLSRALESDTHRKNTLTKYENQVVFGEIFFPMRVFRAERRSMGVWRRRDGGVLAGCLVAVSWGVLAEWVH